MRAAPPTEATKSESIPSDGSAPTWPRITLVTAVYNGERYLEETIRSVVYQGYPNLEYFIVDGGSTDGTVDIIRKYENYISAWISEPDKGMYDALNKGFARSSGEIMGWLNADDKLHTKSLFLVSSVFRELSDVEWITGRPTWFDKLGMTIRVGEISRWSRYRFLAGANRYIQQESTFWRRSLWEAAGGYVDAGRRVEGDFELWVRFFRHAKLHSVDTLIGGFRMHGDNLGLQDMERLHRSHDEIVEAELDRIPHGKALKFLRSLNRGVKKIPGVRYFSWRLIERPAFGWPGPDRPPVIRYQDGKWSMT